MSRIVIEAGNTEKQYWFDVWRYRELFYFLAWRDILVRYKQTIIGIAWAVIRPLLMMLIFVFVRNNFIGNENLPDVPGPILIFVAQMPWLFFATALAESSNSLVVNANLVSKVYFPRLVVPASSVITSLVDFAISLCLLAGMMAFYQYGPTYRILYLPVFTLLAFFAALGPGLLFTALNVRYRDFRYIVPFVVQMGLYASPIMWLMQELSESPDLQLWVSLNPMVGVINGFRWMFLQGQVELFLPSLYISIASSTLFLLVGIWYFRKTEKTFADVI